MMFHSGSPSPYSSFFMSGFQHASNSAPGSSISPSFPVDEDDWFMPDLRRRGSLPTDESASVEKQLSVRKPKSTRERSWLSLDLARQRTSSLRSMPSPKPAPSVCLPALPTLPEGQSSPAPSSVLLPLSPQVSSPKSQSSSVTKSSASRVSFLPLSSSPLKQSFNAKPASIIVPSNPLARSNSSLTKKSSSTVSTRYRRAKRTDALARLEGRASHWEGRFSWVSTRKTSIKRSYNFMSMSDDESDSDVEESFFDIGVEFPSSLESHHRSHSSPDVPTSPTNNSSFWIASPISPASQHVPFPMPTFTLSRAPTNKRRRSKTLSQFLPGLTSFIDLEKENPDFTQRDSKRWRGRSFIEIASL